MATDPDAKKNPERKYFWAFLLCGYPLVASHLNDSLETSRGYLDSTEILLFLCLGGDSLQC